MMIIHKDRAKTDMNIGPSEWNAGEEKERRGNQGIHLHKLFYSWKKNFYLVKQRCGSGVPNTR